MTAISPLIISSGSFTISASNNPTVPSPQANSVSIDAARCNPRPTPIPVSRALEITTGNLIFDANSSAALKPPTGCHFRIAISTKSFKSSNLKSRFFRIDSSAAIFGWKAIGGEGLSYAKGGALPDVRNPRKTRAFADDQSNAKYGRAFSHIISKYASQTSGLSRAY